MKKVFILLSMLLIALSCSPRKKSELLKEFYLSQERDSFIIGKYKLITFDSHTIPFYYYKSTGELIISASEKFDTLNVDNSRYWYSKGGAIHILTIDDRIKLRTDEQIEKYYFNSSYDTLNLEFINVKNETIYKTFIRL